MAIANQTAKQEIRSYVENCGGAYSDWYVGIASDPRQRLFVEHNVDEENGQWIYYRCESSYVAREVEEFFVNTLGTSGGTGGGDSTTRYVYAYKITRYTKE